ncbi:capsular polysaccharide transport system permease protein [Shimia isoporae]|uniref:Capsular polysaccharide transport system permease protein n=1 Tax=Shimia isoporae TaxID=647720 RepID=A0A4R1N4F3_9RHOB|nr:capsule biosynthesis protein [Shimia isoporae]TCK98934.1 capsular polysaccharide transport system permease protein [Shimia isoporae]
MTTKPKAKKFRIRRSVPQSAAETGAPAPKPRVVTGGATPAQPVESVQPQQAAPQPAQAATPKPPAPSTSGSPDTDIDAIKREGLTGRQLRLARRMAQKHGLAATSDYDAVRLLRNAGIDPFQRTNMLDLLPNDQGSEGNEETGKSNKMSIGRIQLPQTMPVDKANLPSTETRSPAEMRAMEIGEIQKDIARRRRRRLLLLLARLSAFVFLPTIFAAWYFYGVATPMYATKSAFLVQQADSTGGSGLGSLLPSQLNANQDAIAVQDYLTSKDAMIRLDSDVGFKSHFSDQSIDPIQRLDPTPSNEEAYKLYKKFVKIGYDPTEGSVRMEVIAADPSVATAFSRALITYAEERVDALSQRKREDQMRDARRSLEEAKDERREAQLALVEKQQNAVVDPDGVIASRRQQISNVQVQLQEKELQLAALLDNTRPNQARVEGVKGDVRRLENLLANLEAQMREATEGEASLAAQAAEIQIAQADLATADLIMQSALQTLKQTELEASRQVRYLTTSVEPVASEDASYPRSFENTILAFLIFSGIYLMISLTASILREQVSS